LKNVTAEEGIGLSEFLRGLRSEIQTAVAEGTDSKVRFRPGPIDLELQVRAERKGGAEAKLEFKVFGTGASAGVEGGLNSGRFQTLKMRLDIVLDPDWNNLISGELNTRPR
jgi:hypothetical protein